MITLFENFKNRKYDIICVKTVNTEESFDAQRLFFKYGFKWDVPGEEFELFQIASGDVKTYFDVLLDTNIIMYELFNPSYFYSSQKSKPDKIFSFRNDKEEIISLLRKYSSIKPVYKPKTIDR